MIPCISNTNTRIYLVDYIFDLYDDDDRYGHKSFLLVWPICIM